MSETTDEQDGDSNEEPRLMTRIDDEEVRLLVHIVPIEDAEDATTEASGPSQGSPPDSPGLAE